MRSHTATPFDPDALRIIGHLGVASLVFITLRLSAAPDKPDKQGGTMSKPNHSETCRRQTGKVIRRLRQAQTLTEADLAEKLSATSRRSEAAVRGWEDGRYYPQGLLVDLEAILPGLAHALLRVRGDEPVECDGCHGTRRGKTGRASATSVLGSQAAVAAATPRSPDAAPKAIHIPSQLALLSAAAVMEAGLVGSDEHKRLDSLYVPRKAETRVLYHIRSGCPLVLLEGDAGNGKTSLLWRIHKSLRELNQFPLFVQSSWFGQTRLEEFLVNLHAAFAEHHSVLLIDSADIILNNSQGHTQIAKIVGACGAVGVPVVVASRREEVASLAYLEHERVRLDCYDDEEMRAAVAVHTRHYYGDGEQRAESDATTETTRILALAAQGCPLHMVCKRPLTLRMLFELYRPLKINDEVDAFALYQEYWSVRVRRDVRPGAAESRDLSLTAQGLALQMVHEGTPAIDRAAAEAWLLRDGLPPADLAELVSRGVMRNERNSVLFFHQTFFEHAAARALVDGWRVSGLQRLAERAESHPSDFFIAPVLEHALLLAVSRAGDLARTAHTIIQRFLNSGQSGLLKIALYVYSHSVAPDAATERAVRECLNRRGAVIHFLKHAGNFRKDRLRTLWRLLRFAWPSNAWSEHLNILELVKELVPRSPLDFIEFANDFDLVSAARESAGKSFHHAEDLLIEAFLGAIAADESWAGERVRHLLSSTRRPGLGLHVRVAELLLSTGQHGVGKRLLLQVSTSAKGRRDSRQFSRAAGRLLALDWIASDEPVEQITVTARNWTGLHQTIALNGLGFVLAQCDSHEVFRGAWATFLSAGSTEIGGWAVCWGVFFDVAQIDGHVCQSFMRQHFEYVIAESSPPQVHHRCLCSAIARSQNGVTIARALLGHISPSSAAWLDADRFGPLLGVAAGAKLPNVLSALRFVPDGDPRFALCETAFAKLAETVVSGDWEGVLAVVEFACLHPDVGGDIAIKLLSRVAASELQERSQCSLSSLCRTLVEAKTEETRRTGLRLWRLLVGAPHAEAPQGHKIIKMLKAERSNSVRILLLDLYIDAVRAGVAGDTNDCVADLLTLVESKDNELVGRAAQAATVAAIHGRTSDHARQVACGLLKRGDGDVRRYAPLSELIDALLDQTVSLAVEVAELIMGTNVRVKGTTFFNALNQTFAMLFSRAPDCARTSLLLCATECGYWSARLVVAASCSRSLEEDSETLDALLAHDDVDPEIKDLIRFHRGMDIRSRGSGWPGVLRELGPRAI